MDKNGFFLLSIKTFAFPVLKLHFLTQDMYPKRVVNLSNFVFFSQCTRSLIAIGTFINPSLLMG